MKGFIIAVLSIIPPTSSPCETVDVIERNNFFDESGRHVFTQWILWEWKDSRHEIVAWRLHKPDFHFQERPPRLRWDEGEVKAACWRETWTQYDPELYERDRNPKEYRKGIFGAK